MPRIRRPPCTKSLAASEDELIVPVTASVPLMSAFPVVVAPPKIVSPPFWFPLPMVEEANAVKPPLSDAKPPTDSEDVAVIAPPKKEVPEVYALPCTESAEEGVVVPIPMRLLVASILKIELEEASVNVKARVLLFCGMKIAEELAPLKEKVVVPFALTDEVHSLLGSYWTLN